MLTEFDQTDITGEIGFSERIVFLIIIRYCTSGADNLRKYVAIQDKVVEHSKAFV